jgi:hypothetical protein
MLPCDFSSKSSIGSAHARAGLTVKSRDSASRPGTAIIIFICIVIGDYEPTTQRTTPSRSGHAQMEIQIMHTLDGHFACWTATTHTDKHGAASSQLICTTSARSPEALLR